MAQPSSSSGARKVPHTDLTTCLDGVDPAKRFGPGHYAPAGNAAVAECLRNDIRALLSAGR